MPNGRILVVESDAIVAWDLAESLELTGRQVCCVGGGVEALREASEFRPEVAIVDADLAGPVDGRMTARLLHKEHRCGVICLTTHPRWKRPAWSAALPVAFLGKPIVASELLAKVAEAIRFHRARARTSHSLDTAYDQGHFCSPTRDSTLVPLT